MIPRASLFKTSAEETRFSRPKNLNFKFTVNPELPMRHLATSVIGICGCLYATFSHKWRRNFTEVKAQPPCCPSDDDMSDCDLNATCRSLPECPPSPRVRRRFATPAISAPRPPRTAATKRPIPEECSDESEERPRPKSRSKSRSKSRTKSRSPSPDPAIHPRKRSKTVKEIVEQCKANARDKVRDDYSERRPIQPHEREFYDFESSSPKKGSGLVGAHADLDWVNYSYGGRVFPYPKTPRRLLIEYNDFLVCYDNEKKAPCWALEVVDSGIKNAYDEGGSAVDSEEEEKIPEDFRTIDTDYTQSMYRQSFKTEHLAEFYRHAQTADDPLVCSNIVAQRVESTYYTDEGDEPETVWDELRSYLGHLMKRHKSIYVLTGPLYLPEQDHCGEWKVKYELIDGTTIAIPTHFFKVILCVNKNNTFRLECYRFENKVHERLDLRQFCVHREELERETGFKIFKEVKDSQLVDTFTDGSFTRRQGHPN